MGDEKERQKRGGGEREREERVQKSDRYNDLGRTRERKRTKRRVEERAREEGLEKKAGGGIKLACTSMIATNANRSYHVSG